MRRNPAAAGSHPKRPEDQAEAEDLEGPPKTPQLHHEHRRENRQRVLPALGVAIRSAMFRHTCHPRRDNCTLGRSRPPRARVPGKAPAHGIGPGGTGKKKPKGSGFERPAPAPPQPPPHPIFPLFSYSLSFFFFWFFGFGWAQTLLPRSPFITLLYSTTLSTPLSAPSSLTHPIELHQP